MSKDRDWNKVMRWVTPIMAGLGLTFGTVAFILVDYHLTEWNVTHLEDEKSPIYLAVKDISDASAKASEIKLTGKMIQGIKAMSVMYTAMKGFDGMTDLALIDHFKEKIRLADTLEEMLPSLIKAVEYVDEVTVEADEKYVEAGRIFYDAKTSEPAYYLDYYKRRFVKREIKYGRPSGLGLNGSTKRFYYRNRNDKPVLLTELSNY